MGGGVRGSSFSERRNGVEIHFTLISMWLSVLYSLFDISNKWTNSIFSSCKNDFLGIWKAIKHEFCENSWVESLARILAERIICIIKDNCSSGAEWGRCWDSDLEWAVRRHYTYSCTMTGGRANILLVPYVGIHSFWQISKHWRWWDYRIG